MEPQTVSHKKVQMAQKTNDRGTGDNEASRARDLGFGFLGLTFNLSPVVALSNPTLNSPHKPQLRPVASRRGGNEGFIQGGLAAAGPVSARGELQQGPGDGQNGTGFVVPLLQMLEAGAQGIGIGLRQIGQALLERLQAILAGVELLLQAVLQEALDQAAHLHVGREEFGAVRRRGHLFDGPHLAQHAQALADRAFAETETMLDIRKTQRLRRGKHDAVEDGHRLRHSQEIGRLGEKAHHCLLERHDLGIPARSTHYAGRGNAGGGGWRARVGGHDRTLGESLMRVQFKMK